MVIEYSHRLGSSTRLYYVLDLHANRLGKTLVERLMLDHASAMARPHDLSLLGSANLA
jgi:hypothetical protein